MQRRPLCEEEREEEGEIRSALTPGNTVLQILYEIDLEARNIPGRELYRHTGETVLMLELTIRLADW